jgi:hypothetical protein
MAGQSAMLTRKEVISMSRNIEIGPNATKTGNTDPNAGTKAGMDVCVHEPKK